VDTESPSKERRIIMNGNNYQVHHVLGIGVIIVSLPLVVFVLSALKTALQWRADTRDAVVDWGMCIG
jgi:hypothetical protein